jgi:hypothetical protein
LWPAVAGDFDHFSPGSGVCALSEMKPHVWRSASVLWTVLLAVFLLTGCARHPAGEPAGAEGLSESDEVAFLLEQSFGFVDDPAPVGYVEDVGGRIVAESGRGDIEYRFKILDTQFPNALALTRRTSSLGFSLTRLPTWKSITPENGTTWPWSHHPYGSAPASPDGQPAW